MRALTLVAITHQHAPFATLECVTLDAAAAQELALALRALPGVDEAVVLSTCNRTELYLAADAESAAAAIHVLAMHTGLPTAHLDEVALVLTGDDASRHLFRVAAGLESRVVGEGEILGQVRAAAILADDHVASGPSLNALFRWAAATGRRARRQAGGPNPPTLARTALDAAGGLDPDDLTIVLGAGAMAAAVTAELRARGLRYRVAARRPERAARLARRPDDALALGDVGVYLGAAALIVCATGARSPILSHRTVRYGRSGAGGQPLTIVDLSMPRNVESGVGDLDGVRLIRLEHLSGGGGDLYLRRLGDTVDAEHRRYLLWLAGQAAGPIIAALRERVTQICLDEAERHLAPGTAARVAHRIAGRVLHAPTIAVKELSAAGDAVALEALATVLGLHRSLADTGAPAWAAS